MSKTEPKKLTRKEQWVINSTKRRMGIIASGGSQLLVMVDAEHTALLNEIIEQRKVSTPGFNKTEWVRRMIVADHNTLKRRKKVTRKGKGDDRSIAPNAQ